MSWTGLFAAAAVTIPAAAAPVPDALRGWSSPPPDASAEPSQAEISVLTYNVRGLPWPVAAGRAEALRAIGRELAQMRREGWQPDVVLIQEGFREEIADLVRISGYRYWARGPARSDRASQAVYQAGPTWSAVRYPLRGEGWGKLTGSGLHVLSDLPITKVEGVVYRHCAGFDCLASKGVMLVRLSLPGGQGEIDVVNTHLNTKRKAGVPRARALRAHQLQTDELLAFLGQHRSGGRPLLIGGDFNMRNAPERYAYRAAARPYQVVAEFCTRPAAGCLGRSSASGSEPWLKSQDLQAFSGGGAAEVRPIRVGEVFRDAADGGRLSDHVGYLVRYRIAWSPMVTDRPAGVDRSLVAQRPPAPAELAGAERVVRANWQPQGPAQ